MNHTRVEETEANALGKMQAKTFVCFRLKGSIFSFIFCYRYSYKLYYFLENK